MFNNKKKGMLVCVIGIDGSGKTTLVKNIIELLNNEDIYFEYRWGKFQSSFLRFVLNVKDIIINYDSNYLYNKNNKLKKNIFSNSILKFIFENFVLLSYFANILINISLPLKKGRNIICDRYTYDTVVDLTFDLGYPRKTIENRISKLGELLPISEMNFYIDIPEEVALSRKNDVPSLEFLTVKKNTYLEIIDISRESDKPFIILDGTCSVDQLTHIAYAKIIDCMENRNLD